MVVDSEAGAVRTETPEPWWSYGRFPERRGTPWATLNRVFDNHCRQYDDVLATRPEDMTADELELVRSDIVVATRWSATRDAITDLAARAKDWAWEGPLFVPALLTLALVSESWTWLVVLLVVDTALLLVPRKDDVPGEVVALVLLSLLALVGVHVLAPLDGFDMAWRLLAPVITLVLTVIVWQAGAWPLTHTPLYPALVLVGVGATAILLRADWVHHLLTTDVRWLPDQLARGVELGLVGGAVLALWFVVVETVNQLCRVLIDRRKLRRIPEQEFVQSAVWAMSSEAEGGGWFWNGDLPDTSVYVPAPALYELGSQWLDSPENRRRMVWRVDWLAHMLELHIARHLAALDPRNATVLTEVMHRRAAVLHRVKRDLLVGDSTGDDQLIPLLWAAIRAGAARRWVLLPESDIVTSTVERTSRRVLRWLRSFLVFLVPAAGAVVAYAGDQNQIALTAALVAGVVLLDMASPGSSTKVADSVDHAGVVKSFFDKVTSNR